MPPSDKASPMSGFTSCARVSATRSEISAKRWTTTRSPAGFTRRRCAPRWSSGSRSPRTNTNAIFPSTTRSNGCCLSSSPGGDISMFNLSDDPFDFAVYYFGLATGPFDARTDYTGKRPQAKQLMARERSIPRIYTLAKYLQQQMPLSLNEIALILFYVRSARSDGGFVNAPTCECRIETAEAN